MITNFNDHPSILLEARKPPCISLYQPTHRRPPENKQDPVVFRNLVKTVEESLLLKYSARDIEPLLAPFRSLADDRKFWNHTLDGIGVLCSEGFYRVYHLQSTVRQIAVVADSFHIKPLVRIFQASDRYQVLCLSRKEIRLFEGNRVALDEVKLADGVPRTIKDVLGDDFKEPHLTVASYGSGARGTPMVHGHGSKKDVIDIDTEKFFRAVDRAVLEHHSSKSGLPLILAALPEYHSLFQKVSHNRFLLPKGIEINPDVLDSEDLRIRAWKVMEPEQHCRFESLIEEFGSKKARGMATDDINEAIKAALAGRVSNLLIDGDRKIPGKIETATGVLSLADLNDPSVDDLLDDIAEMVFKTRGDVKVISGERMPGDSGLAAIYRF